MNNNCKKETCASKWQEDYDNYLKEEKCKEEIENQTIMSMPGNTYGLNEEYACQHSRLRVYMNYTGKDRLNWNYNNSTCTMTKEEIKQLYESNPNTNAFTNAEKAKLATLYNYNDAYIISQLGLKVDKVSGYGLSQSDFTPQEKMKLAMIVPETATTIKAKYESNPNTNAFTDTDKAKLDNLQVDTPANIKLKYESNPNTNAFTDNEKIKLASLENYNDAAIITQLNNKVDKIAGKGLSTNDYTDEEKDKLAGLESSKFRGKFPDVASLPLTGNTEGSYAYVGMQGEDDKSYIWDSDDNQWVLNNGGATAETPASIKIKYESNPDTNAFTDARRDKLDSLENYDDTFIVNSLSNKVDKIPGKQLSTEDYTTSEKNKLASLNNYDDTAIYTALSNKVDKVTGKQLSTEDYTTAEKNKLASLSNYNDTAIYTALNNKVDKITGYGLSQNDFTNTLKTKLDGIAPNANNYVLPASTETTLGGVKTWFGTQAQYDALTPKQTDTLYFIQS